MKNKQLKNAGIILLFFPLIAFVIYIIIGWTNILGIVWMSFSTWGIIWCFFALILAFVALWDTKTGSVLAIPLGVIFFLSSVIFDHYQIIYLPMSVIYIVGGALLLIYSMGIKK